MLNQRENERLGLRARVNTHWIHTYFTYIYIYTSYTSCMPFLYKRKQRWKKNIQSNIFVLVCLFVCLLRHCKVSLFRQRTKLMFIYFDASIQVRHRKRNKSLHIIGAYNLWLLLCTRVMAYPGYISFSSFFRVFNSSWML